jgi:hypothetical protein
MHRGSKAQTVDWTIVRRDSFVVGTARRIILKCMLKK